MKILRFNKSTLYSLFFFLVSSLVFAGQADQAWSQPQVNSEDLRLHVVSDKMIAQKDAAMVEFVGHVKATRSNSTVLADSIKIYFNTDTPADDTQARVQKIVSSGNIEYTEKDRKAFADHAVYTTKDDILILTGEAPKLVTGSSFVTGKKITLFRKQDTVIVESDGNKRVEALFNPEDNITDKP